MQPFWTITDTNGAGLSCPQAFARPCVRVRINGSIDRFFHANDDQTGKLLWETRLSDVPSNAPIPYSVNGKQYIAIGVGNGGAQATGFAPLVPEIQNVDRAPAVWVFKLP
jgi:alcohol dehydrogenase (cytochrome c)